MIKMLFSDIDGTMLDDTYGVSSALIEKLNNLIDTGIIFVPCTGRSGLDLHITLKGIHFNQAILLNGSLYKENDSIKDSFSISPLDLKMSFDVIKKYKGEFIAYMPEYYVSDNPERVIQLFIDGEKKVNPDFDASTFGDDEFFKNIKKINSIDELMNEPVMKIEIVFNDLNELDLTLEGLKVNDNISITQAHPYNIEINNKLTTKGNMVNEVRKLYGLERDEIAVAGDSTNDVSMFYQTRNSFAMGNATEEVQKQATYVVRKNTEKGFLDVIDKIIEINKI